MLTSCSLMSEEEILPASPAIYSYTAEEYKLTTVMRGGLVLDTSVRCTYIPAKEMNLSFALGNAYIDKVYVQKGDRVKKGQVLAQVAQDNLQEQIALQKFQLDILDAIGMLDEPHEEYAVLDKAGRVQIPRELLESIGVNGNKVSMELVDGKIVIGAPPM